mgnify:FL=1
MRLNKYLSEAGICSRRVADKIISEGKVKVNNKVITTLGTKIDLKEDTVYCYNKLVELPDKLIYLALNKPRGYITTKSDPKKRKIVMDLIPREYKVYPIGRLDKESEGLIILTNDGELTQKLTHPKYGHEKEYRVKVNKKITTDYINSFKRGIKLEEGIAKADRIDTINDYEFNLVIHQGWKRQIRRMSDKLDNEVVSLKRIRISKLKLNKLKVGEYKEIKINEIIS